MSGHVSAMLDATAVVPIVRKKDGLRVLIIHTSSLGRIAQVQVDVRVGDDAEGGTGPEQGSAQRETAHYLEHLVASLLRSRGYPQGEAKSWVEEHGIYSNAFTSAVRTSHYMNGHVNKLGDMINIQVGAVADFLGYGGTDYFAELAASNRFAMEKEAVVRELSSKVDGTGYRMYEAMNALVFQGHPRSVSQRFDRDNVGQLDEATVRAFFERHYVARNMMVTVAGPAHLCGTKRIMEMLDLYTFRAGEPTPQPGLVPFERRPGSQPVRVEFVPLPGSSTVRVTMAWPLRLRQYETGGAKQRTVAALGALTNFLTGGFTSRLLNRLRVQDGLVYSVSAGSDLDERSPEYGTYQISTSVDADDVTHLVRDTFQELRRMMEGPTPDEMAKYKFRIETAMERRILDQSPGSWVDDYANQALFAPDDGFETDRVIVTNGRRFTRSLAVSFADVRRVVTDEIDFVGGHMIFLYGGDPAIVKVPESGQKGLHDSIIAAIDEARLGSEPGSAAPTPEKKSE